MCTSSTKSIAPSPGSARIAAWIAVCLTCSSAVAEQRQLGTHEHGTAVLNVAMADSTLSIEYKTPASNLVGFEHEASTDEQTRAIHEAEEVLESGKILTLPKGATCKLTTSEVEHEAEHDGEEDEHHEETEHHDEEEEQHADDDHGDHEAGSHSEFHALFIYDCQNIGALTHIDVNLFELFPGNEKILSQVITPNGQTGAELTQDSARLVLPGNSL